MPVRREVQISMPAARNGRIHTPLMWITPEYDIEIEEVIAEQELEDSFSEKHQE